MADYTTIDDPTEYFQVKIWTGNATNRTIDLDNNATMQPDFSWVKSRSNAYEQYWENSSRGTDKYLRSNRTSAQDNGTVVTYNSTGFGIGSGAENNEDSTTNVGWFWKGNGGTRSTFTESGDNPGGGYQVNTTAGFSIVDYTGTGGAGTISHGLTAKPEFIMVKRTSGTADWNVYHAANTSAPETDYLRLNLTNATSDATRWNDTAPTTSVFSVGTDDAVNGDASTYLAFVFAPKQGFSKFGKYVGNGASDAAPSTLGPFIYTGFSPALVIIKKTSAVDSWYLFDNKRAGYDPAVYRLYGESTSAETGGTNNTIQFTSNGFKVRFHGGSLNESGGAYIYMAFAEQPFVTSTDTNSIPATAR